MIQMAEVSLSAPKFPQVKPISCWRLHRSDFELRLTYHRFVLRTQGVFIVLTDIEVNGERQAA